MNIEQMLRDAIESKTARILKGDDYYYQMVKSHTSKADEYEKVAVPNMPTHWMKMPTHP